MAAAIVRRCAPPPGCRPHGPRLPSLHNLAAYLYDRCGRSMGLARNAVCWGDCNYETCFDRPCRAFGRFRNRRRCMRDRRAAAAPCTRRNLSKIRLRGASFAKNRASACRLDYRGAGGEPVSAAEAGTVVVADRFNEETKGEAGTETMSASITATACKPLTLICSTSTSKPVNASAKAKLSETSVTPACRPNPTFTLRLFRTDGSPIPAPCFPAVLDLALTFRP